MNKLFSVAMLVGGISLMNPALAADDYDDGDYAAAPRAHAMSQPKQKASEPAPVAVVDDYDDGDYAAAPRVRAVPKAKPQASAPKRDANKVASIAPVPVKAKKAKRQYIEAFE